MAQRWRYRDGTGEVGVVASVTQPFCGDCTRARLSAEGVVYTCLFATHGTDLRKVLRASPSNELLDEAVHGTVAVEDEFAKAGVLDLDGLDARARGTPLDRDFPPAPGRAAVGSRYNHGGHWNVYSF